MLSVTYGLHAAFMALRMKASFHASPDVIMALHAKHRQHQSKNPGFQPKKSLRLPFLLIKENQENRLLFTVYR